MAFLLLMVMLHYANMLSRQVVLLWSFVIDVYTLDSDSCTVGNVLWQLI